MERNIYKIGKKLFITSDEEIKIRDWYYDINDNESLFPIYQRSQDTKFYIGCEKIILTTDPQLIANGVQPIPDEFLEWFVKNPSCENVEVRYSYPTIDDEGDGSISEGYWLLIIPEENKIYRECPNGCRGKLSYLMSNNECLCSCGTKWNIETNKIIIPKEEPKQECNWSDIEEDCVNDECECERKEILSQAKHRALKQETLEKAAEIYASHSLKEERQKDLNMGFQDGAKWQEQRMYSEEEILDLLNKREDYINSEDNIFDYQSTNQWFEQFKKK
jgi:hypothetical protein